MKRSIEWHQGCAKNRWASVSQARAQLEAQQKRLEKLQSAAEFYSAQIALAIEEGKDGFDEERYGFKKLIGI